MDFGDPNPIVIDRSDLDKKYEIPLKQMLINLFVQGLWMYDNTSMSTILNILLTPGFNNNMVEQMTDLLRLDKVTNIVYNNQVGSILIVPYLLSFLNTIFLHSCNNQYLLENFDIYSYLCNLQISKPRIEKLENMLLSILHIKNNTYYNFINIISNEFLKIMELNPIIQMPYIKGVNDFADLYGIGGVDLYNYSPFSNPLVRAYKFYTVIFGNSEGLESFYRWILQVNNSSLFQVIEDNTLNKSVIISALQAQSKNIPSNKYPNILFNYEFFSNGTYSTKPFGYYLDITNSSNVSYLDILLKYIFAKTNPEQITQRCMYSRQIIYNNSGKLEVQAPYKEGLVVHKGPAKNIYPLQLSLGGIAVDMVVYDMVGDVKPQEVIFTNPPGTRLIPLILEAPTREKNNVIWIFTTMPQIDRYQRYQVGEEDITSSPSDSSGTMIDRILPKPLMVPLVPSKAEASDILVT